MTQASADAKKTGQAPLGVAAAAAATGTTPKPDDKTGKPADDKAATNGATPTSGTVAGTPGTATGSGAAAEKKARNASKVFIVTGTVHEFETPAKAEKFLNAEGAPADYSVLRGKRIGTSKKVSLR
jgi:hypothetical protein